MKVACEKSAGLTGREASFFDAITCERKCFVVGLGNIWPGFSAFNVARCFGVYGASSLVCAQLVSGSTCTLFTTDFKKRLSRRGHEVADVSNFVCGGVSMGGCGSCDVFCRIFFGTRHVLVCALVFPGESEQHEQGKC